MHEIKGQRGVESSNLGTVSSLFRGGELQFAVGSKSPMKRKRKGSDLLSTPGSLSFLKN